jgi:hypothetical protein
MYRKQRKKSKTQIVRKPQHGISDHLNNKEPGSIAKREQLNTRQGKRSPQNKSTIVRYGKPIFQTLLYMNLLYMIYSVLSPSVQVEYSSDILPQNENAIPIKLINNSNYAIYNVIADYIVSYQLKGYNLNENTIHDREITSRLARKTSMSFVDEHVVVSPHLRPIGGTVTIKLMYDLPIIWKKICVYRTFQMYINKDNSVRWLTVK